jgi:hypothetical protein
VSDACNAVAAEKILRVLESLPDEEARKAVLADVMKHRCPRCFDFSADGSFWCCYDSRGD